MDKTVHSIDDAENLYKSILMILDDFKQKNTINENIYNKFKDCLKINLKSAVDRTLDSKIKAIESPRMSESIFKIYNETLETLCRFKNDNRYEIMDKWTYEEFNSQLSKAACSELSFMLHNNIRALYNKKESFEEIITNHSKISQVLNQAATIWRSSFDNYSTMLTKQLKSLIFEIFDTKIQATEDSPTLDNIVKAYDDLSKALDNQKNVITKETCDKAKGYLKNNMETAMTKLFSQQIETLSNSKTLNDIIKIYDELSKALNGLKKIDEGAYNKFMDDLKNNMETAMTKLFSTQIGTLSNSKTLNETTLSKSMMNYQKH